MELFLALGFLAFVALCVAGAMHYLQQRRAGTIVAVTIPLRRLSTTRRGEPATHR